MSLRLRVFNFTARLVFKPALRRQRDVSHARKSYTRMARALMRPPPFTVVLPDAALGGDWVWTSKAKSCGVVLYLHGGGYIMGGLQTHMAMVARLSRNSGLRAFVVDYRLAPEHPFPAAIEDAKAAWDGLIARGYCPDQIVIGGDSAGGGLALALLAQLCQTGTIPLALFAFSPWTDLVLSGKSMSENAGRDVLFPAERTAELREMVVPEHLARDPRISPLFAEFPNCPPVLLQCSDCEILRDDTLRMAQRLRAFGGDVTVQSLPDRPHVWQMFDRLFPEAQSALRDVGTFIAARLRAPRSGDS